ncbi:hypothetical protein ACHBTE_08855 [Streptomyces sp. M41]
MKRRALAAAAVAMGVAMVGLLLSAASGGPGGVGSDDWNIFLTNVFV